MEFEVTPGAVLAVAAPAPPADVVTTADRQHRPRQRRRRQRLESMSHSHAVPNHPSCIPPRMPVTVAAGLHAHLLTPCDLSRRRTAFPSPSPTSCSQTSLRVISQFKNSLWRSNSRSARTSSGRTAGSTSTWRATSGWYPHDEANARTLSSNGPVPGRHRGHAQHAVVPPQDALVGDDAHHPLPRRRDVGDRLGQPLRAGPG